MRKLRGMFGLDDAGGYEAVADGGASPEERVLLQRVYRVLDTLPADLRIAWALRYIEGERLDAVAVLSGCSLATAKRRISAAALALNELVGCCPTQKKSRSLRARESKMDGSARTNAEAAFGPLDLAAAPLTVSLTAALTALVVLAVGGGFWRLLLVEREPALVASALLALEDDPVSALSKETRVTPVEVSPTTTTIRLESGSAGFDVTPHSERRFRVLAEDVVVSVLGTAFTVERGSRVCTCASNVDGSK